MDKEERKKKFKENHPIMGTIIGAFDVFDILEFIIDFVLDIIEDIFD